MEYPKLFGRDVPMIPLVDSTQREVPCRATFSEEELPIPQESDALIPTMVKNFEEQGKQATNGEVLALTAFSMAGASLSCTYRPTHYLKSLATTYPVLDQELSGGETVRGKYGNLYSMLTPDGFSRSPYARLVGTSTVVVTNDEKIIFQRRSNKLAVAAGQMHVSLAEGMKKVDVNREGIIDPRMTVVRAWKQEIQDPGKDAPLLPMKSEWVQILALGLSAQYLQPDFAMLARVPYEASAILEQAKQARGKWERVEIITTGCNESSLQTLLEANPDWSPHALFALAMAIEATLLTKQLKQKFLLHPTNLLSSL